MKKLETRIIPEETNPKFFFEHLKPYEFMKADSTGKKVLEIGCGDGYGAAYLAQVAAEVIGIDYEEDIILKARDKYKCRNLIFMDMDAVSLRYQDGSFDVACSFQVIEHIPEEQLPLYLSEIKRVLKKGGKFYLSTLNLGHTMKSPLTYKKNPAHCKEFRFLELKELLSSVFPDIEFYGLHLTPKHNFYRRLKKVGIFNFLPKAINPVAIFYRNVTLDDFMINKTELEKAIDFICICKKGT
jgi:SAM-dependent methyltransferase